MAGIPAGVGIGGRFLVNPLSEGLVLFPPDDVTGLVGGGDGGALGIEVIVGHRLGGIG